MAILAGKNLVVSVSTTTGGTYYAVAGMNDASMSMSADNQDITVFGDTFIAKLQGLKDVSYSLSGFYDTADTNGQIVLRDAFLNDTALFVKFLADGTNGWKQEVKVASFDISGTVDGIVELSIELEGSATITAVP